MKANFYRLFYVFLFVVIVFILDVCVGLFFNVKLKELPDDGERIAKTNYAINKVNSDIVIIGSSRAETGYNPKILMDSLPQYTVYNCGGDGQGFFYCNTLINTILDRYVPRYIVWDFKESELAGDSDANLSMLYPFYKNNTIKCVIDQKMGWRSQVLMRCNSYRFNATAGRIIRAIYSPSRNLQNSFGFGPRPVHAEGIHLVPNDFILEKGDLNDEKISLFKATVERAQKAGCTIVVVISPMYNIYNYDNVYTQGVNALCEKYSIPFFDDSHLNGFPHNNDLAYDNYHLNIDGANLFTSYFSKQLKDYIVKKSSE